MAEPGYQVGNKAAEEQREKAARDEIEAWKIAQLAATLASRLSRERISAEDSMGAVKDAEALLIYARERVSLR